MKAAIVTFLVCMFVSFGAMAQDQRFYSPYAPYYPAQNYNGYQGGGMSAYQPYYPQYAAPRHNHAHRRASRRYHPRIPQRHPGDYRDAVDRGQWSVGSTGTNFPYTR